MNNDEWAVTFEYGSALLKEQPNRGEEQDKEDPLFNEKRKEWSRTMHLAKHTRRPNFFRPPRYGPDDLSSQGSTRSDDSRSKDDLSDDGDARSNDADDESNKAIEPLVEPPAPDAAC